MHHLWVNNHLVYCICVQFGALSETQCNDSWRSYDGKNVIDKEAT